MNVCVCSHFSHSSTTSPEWSAPAGCMVSQPTWQIGVDGSRLPILLVHFARQDRKVSLFRLQYISPAYLLDGSMPSTCRKTAERIFYYLALG